MWEALGVGVRELRGMLMGLGIVAVPARGGNWQWKSSSSLMRK
jgi:hypothetical protein